MPPRKRARGGAQTVSTPSTHQDDDAMDIDTPRAENRATSAVAEKEVEDLNHYWTDDQVASLFKAVIRWKPAGMHRHFRMIAISEHLRNHGFDPDIYSHTRIPHIWTKLKTYYNLDLIDEREYYDNEEMDEKYVEFTLPKLRFHDAMIRRAVRGASEPRTSSPEMDASPRPSPPKKRRLRESTSKGRGPSVADTEDGTDVPSPATTARSGRVSRGRRRAASQPKEKPRKIKTPAKEGEDKDEGEDDGEEAEEDVDDHDEDEEEEEDEEGEDDNDDDEEEDEDADESGSDEDDGSNAEEEKEEKEKAKETVAKPARRSAKTRGQRKPPKATRRSSRR